jgi:hypothetical protein
LPVSVTTIPSALRIAAAVEIALAGFPVVTGARLPVLSNVDRI